MGKGITRRIFKGDRVVWTIFFILCALSLIEVFSATSRQTYGSGNYWQPITKHALFLIAGVGVVWFIHNLKIEWIKLFTKLIYLSGVIFLIYALVGGDRVNDSARWVTLLGVRFQPLEIAKMGLVMMTALVLAKAQTKDGTFLSLTSAMSLINLRPQNENNIKDYTMMTIIAISIIPCGLIFLENLSTVVIVGATLLMMMFIGQVNKWHMLTLIGSAVVAGGLCLTLIMATPESAKDGNSFQRKMLTWKHRLVDVSGADKNMTPEQFYKHSLREGNEQKMYSKLAIGTSGLFGKGPGNSVQRDFIPHAYSDFIYSIIVEELGWIGGVAVLLLYLTLLYRSGKIASKCEEPYPAFLVMGVAILITMQAMMHMHISVGDFVTGQPLPLVSQGGTSILINCVYIGIILSVSRYVKRFNKEESNENITNTPVAE